MALWASRSAAPQAVQAGALVALLILSVARAMPTEAPGAPPAADLVAPPAPPKSPNRLTPTPTTDARSDSQRQEISKYLRQFGYVGDELESRSFVSNVFSAEDGLRKGIERFQRFANLPVTGQADAATMAQMAKPRCGVGDIDWARESVKRKRRYLVHGDPWPRMNLTYSITDWPTNLDPNFVRQKIDKAIRVWSKHSKLTFTETRNSKADILVKFLKGRHGDAYPFDGPGMVLAHAYFPGGDIGGDVHFDADENWGGNMATLGVELFVAGAHEFGHSMGLAHVSEPSSLMYPWYQDSPQFTEEQFQLPEDDVRGIQHLYGRPDRAVDNGSPRRYVTTRRPVMTTSTRRNEIFLAAREQPPEPCDLDGIDAISMIRGETFIFKGKYFFRLDNDLQVMSSHAFEVNRLFHGFPSETSEGHDVVVDAVYENRRGEIHFFIGRELYVFLGQTLKPGYPVPLASLGLPLNLTHIDAAFVWGYNQKIYLFHNDLYWRYDEYDGRVEADYPRHIRSWGGVPARLDAVFTWTDQSTYFFKGRQFWRFYDKRMSIFNDSGSIVQFWFGCYGNAPRMAGALPLIVLLVMAFLPTVLNVVLMGPSLPRRYSTSGGTFRLQEHKLTVAAVS